MLELGVNPNHTEELFFPLYSLIRTSEENFIRCVTPFVTSASGRSPESFVHVRIHYRSLGMTAPGSRVAGRHRRRTIASLIYKQRFS